MNGRSNKPDITSPRNLERLRQALERKGIVVSGSSAITRRAENGPCELSFAQQRLWFLHQVDPTSPRYNISLAARLLGTLNIRALENTLSEVVRRHEILRTTFTVIAGHPMQVVIPASFQPLPVIALESLPEAEREREARLLCIEESQQAFGLNNGALLKAKLLKLASDENIALISMHHIIIDGWSIGLLMREIEALYEAFSSGKPAPLTEPPIQYADFAVWQREQLKGEKLQELLDYWRDYLSGASFELKFPKRKLPVEPQGPEGAQCQMFVPAALVAVLKDLSRKENCSLFIILLAAYQVTLYHFTGQRNFVLGTDVANRNLRETEELIGFFVNQLALRADLSTALSFRTLLRRLREDALGAYAHQNLPFEKLVEALRPDRDHNRTPLFQVKLVLQNAPLPLFKLPGLKAIPLETRVTTAKFDLLLNLTDGDEGLSGYLEYNRALFEESAIELLISYFQLVLTTVVAQPEVRLGELRDRLTALDESVQTAKESALRATRLQKFTAIRRKPLISEKR